jgi:ectoine hydroxylase-related dioxygenase (phytanoyl-CoA dioxygenase family)
MLHTNIPWIESPFFSQILETKQLSSEQKEMAQFYHDNGFLRLSAIIPHDLIDQVKRDVATKGFDKNFEIKTMRDDSRIQDFWQYSEPTRKLACLQPVLDILELFYGREAIPFQTLNFCVGSQQRAHSDSIHFSSLPSRYMCGVWVALEDVTIENGPLFYYPGSHKMPEYNFSQIKESANPTTYDNYREYEDFIEALMNVSNYKKEIFLAKKGEALIWSSNIVHGGMPVLTAGSRRWSQVTHYFFKDCYYYTPMLSNMVTDELCLRNALLNIKTKKEVAPSYNGQTISYLKTSTNKYIVNQNLSLLHVLKMYGKKYAKKLLKR